MIGPHSAPATVLLKAFLLFLLASAPHLVWANSGRIVYVSGSVTVERAGKTYLAVRNAKVIEGDLIKTRSGGRIHIRMSDRSLFSLKPNTEFRIEEYRFAEPIEAKGRVFQPESQSDIQPEPRGFYRLLRGGLRAVTGLIGKEERERYSIRTLVATIGVRGTSFTADLSDPDLLASSEGTTLGVGGPTLTVGVGSGAVILTNTSGTLVLENGEFGRVTSPNTPPQRLLVPPVDSESSSAVGAPIEDDDSDPGGGASGLGGRRQDVGADPSTGAGSEGAREDNLANRDTEVPELQRGPGMDLAYTLDQIFAESGDSSRSDPEAASAAQTLRLAPESTRQNATGNVTGFVGAVPGRGGDTLAAVIELRDGAVVNAGFDPASGLRWGRWTVNSATLRYADGSEEIITLDPAQIHLIQSATFSNQPVMPISGSASYRLVGNTDPTSSQGSIGDLGNARLSADFSNGTLDSTLILGIGERNWSAQGSGHIGQTLSAGTPINHFAGEYPTVTIDGNAGGDGVFSGFFTGDAIGAGLSYTLRGEGETVNGAAAFRRE